MNEFEVAWRKIITSPESVQPELKALVRAVFEEVTVRPARTTRLRNALDSLLSFLSSSAGRTESNCVVTDQFFCLQDAYPWDHLPSGYREVVADLGGALHDTFSSPHIAASCESTPEQLLGRVRKL
jgi:hypothetical protein